MSNGTVDALKESQARTVIFNEERRTYYKLHPDQVKRPGEIITMPNLPDDKYHWDLWHKRNYATNPQDLMPNAKLITTEEGELKFDLETPLPSSEFVCDVCGQVCKNAFGLNSHKRSHK